MQILWIYSNVRCNFKTNSLDHSSRTTRTNTIIFMENTKYHCRSNCLTLSEGVLQKRGEKRREMVIRLPEGCSLASQTKILEGSQEKRMEEKENQDTILNRVFFQSLPPFWKIASSHTPSIPSLSLPFYLNFVKQRIRTQTPTRILFCTVDFSLFFFSF